MISSSPFERSTWIGAMRRRHSVGLRLLRSELFIFPFLSFRRAQTAMIPNNRELDLELVFGVADSEQTNEPTSQPELSLVVQDVQLQATAMTEFHVLPRRDSHTAMTFP